MRSPRLPAPDVREKDPDSRDAVLTVALLDELLVRFTAAYEELKLLRGGVDFDDLELAAGELLETRPRVRAAWSERFELLMVDEFQDTNPRQLAILRALERGNLFTVGDEFQSIYGFRHADVELFRERRDALAATGQSLSLTRNFRSRPALLDVVNEIFGRAIRRLLAVACRARGRCPRRIPRPRWSCCSTAPPDGTAPPSSKHPSPTASGRLRCGARPRRA